MHTDTRLPTQIEKAKKEKESLIFKLLLGSVANVPRLTPETCISEDRVHSFSFFSV